MRNNSYLGIIRSAKIPAMVNDIVVAAMVFSLG